MSCVFDELIEQYHSPVCVYREQQWEWHKLLTWGIQPIWTSLNPAAPSPREAEEDRIPAGAPTHVPEAGMGCWENAPNPGIKGTLTSCCCSLSFARASQAAQGSLEEFSKDKSSPATPGVFHLHSGADQAISPVITEEAELKQGCGNKSCCSGYWPNELMSSFQGLSGFSAEKLAEMGAMQVPRQFYFFKQ